MNTFKIKLYYRLYSDVWVDNTTLSKIKFLTCEVAIQQNYMHSFHFIMMFLYGVNIANMNCFPWKVDNTTLFSVAVWISVVHLTDRYS